MEKTTEFRFQEEQIIRAAALAGSGASADEIAADLKMTPQRVYHLLRLHGLPLVHRTPNQVAFVVTISEAAMAEIERICWPLGVDPERALAHIVERVAENPALLTEIAKEFAEESAKKAAKAAKPRAPRRRSAKSEESGQEVKEGPAIRAVG